MQKATRVLCVLIAVASVATELTLRIFQISNNCPLRDFQTWISDDYADLDDKPIIKIEREQDRFDDAYPIANHGYVLNSGNYINASNMNAFSDTPLKYIAAQWPLPDAREDFFNMVLESGAKMIIAIEGNVKRDGFVYWPERVGGTIKHGVVKISKISEKKIRDITWSQLLVENTKTHATSLLEFCLFDRWVDMDIPLNDARFGSLVAKLTKCQGKVIVHCTAGVGRTGVLVTIASFMDRYSVADIPDRELAKIVKRMVRTFRTQRSKFILIEAQYKFVIDYLIMNRKKSSIT